MAVINNKAQRTKRKKKTIVGLFFTKSTFKVQYLIFFKRVKHQRTLYPIVF